MEGVGLYAKDWSRNWNAVGKHAGVSAQQAAGRWSSHLDPRIASHKHGPWTEQEVRIIHPYCCDDLCTCAYFSI